MTVTIAGGFTGTVTERDFVAPTPRPVRPYSRVSTIGELSGNSIGKILRQIALRVANYRDSDPATQVMIKRAVEEMPMRGMALFSQGKVSLGMVDALADLANRRPDRVVRSFAGWATRLLAKS